MNNKYQLQWFPGHMAKTRRMIQDNLKLVDVVIKLVDARLPLSSRNPDVDKIIGSKPRIVVLNKADIADNSLTMKWLNYFKDKNIEAISANSQTGKGLKKELDNAIEIVLADKFKRDETKGIQRHAVKMMVIGIPNVGKSSFINRLSGRAAAKTGDRPGITQTKQWIRIAGKYELLDTPGILWPKFENEDDAKKIAFTGGIKDEILDVEDLAYELLGYLKQSYMDSLLKTYNLNDSDSELNKYELLESIGRKRGCVISGGEVDTFRTANIIISDFRSAKLGGINSSKNRKEMRKTDMEIDLLQYEKDLISRGYEYICGIDEAGRGPLAGPVCAAAVILPNRLVIDGVNDSKKLSEKKREKLYNEIIESALAYSVQFVFQDVIDEINIRQATHAAMQNAVNGLKIHPDILIVDGNDNIDFNNIETLYIKKGDSLSQSIAAASITGKSHKGQIYR